MSGREIEVLSLLIETDSRFVKHTVVLKDISLADFAYSKAIKQGFRDRVPAVRDGVNTAVRLPHDLIGIGSAAKCQSRVRSQNLTVVSRRQRPAHRRHQVRF